MTWAQWLAEYHAIRAREELEASVRLQEQRRGLFDLCEAMIRLLGLNLMHPSYKPPPPPVEAGSEVEAAAAGPTITPYMPAAWLWTHPRMLEALQKQRESNVEGQEEFDTFSRKLQAVAEKRAEPESLGAFADFFNPEVWNRKPNSVWERELADRVLRGVKKTDADAGAGVPDVSMAHVKMADSRIESDRKAAGLITDAKAAVVSSELDKFQRALLDLYGEGRDGQ